MAWPVLCGLLGVGMAWAGLAGNPDALAWSPQHWANAPWTLWTASLVHLSPAHALANLLALGALALLGWGLHAGRAAVWAALLAWPLGTWALLAWPEVVRYSGLSGLLHALVGVLWAHSLLFAARPWSFVVFTGLTLKLLSEQGWVQPVVFDPSWGFNVVSAAHFSGALAGMVCGLGVGLWVRWLQPPAAIIRP